MSKTHKVMKEVKSNKLSSNNEAELSRIRKFANMEKAVPEHFDMQTYQFDSPTIIQKDMTKKRPFAKGTEGTEVDDSHHLKNKNISFPVRGKIKD
jgi:hypothetical protein